MVSKPTSAHRGPALATGMPLIVPVALAVAVLIVYLQTAGFEFVRYDDELYVTKNPRVLAGLTRDGVMWAFSTLEAGFWHPLTWISLMADRTLFGMKAGGYHVTNLLLHLASVLLLYQALRRMTGRTLSSAIVAGIFAVHPLHAESVAWVAERKDVLSAFFWMLGMWGYGRYAERPGLGRYGWVLLFFGLGLMSKTMVVTFPFVLLLLDVWPLGRIGHGGPGNWGMAGLPDGRAGEAVFPPVTPGQALLEKIPFFLLALGAGILTVKAQSGAGALPSVAAMPLDLRLDNALVSYVRYLGKILWPVDLAVFYPHPLFWPPWKVVLSAALLVAITIGVWRTGKGRPYLAVGWLWFLGTLVPVIGLVQLGSQAMADRYVHLPMIGLAIMAVWGLGDLLAARPRNGRAAALLAGGALVALTAAGFVQVGHWRNSETLFSHALEVTEGNYLAHNNLGALYLERGDNAGAARHFLAALAAMPRSDMARVNLGKVMANQGRYPEAAALFSEALRINPAYPDGRRHLGDALLRQNLAKPAIAAYREALRMRGDDPELQNNLGVALASQGRTGEAVSRFRKALALRPDYPDAEKNLAAVTTRGFSHSPGGTPGGKETR